MQEELDSKKVNLTPATSEEAHLPSQVCASPGPSKMAFLTQSFSRAVKQYLQPPRPRTKLVLFALLVSLLSTFICCAVEMRILTYSWDWTDPGHLNQVFRNTCDNALRGFFGACIACTLVFSGHSFFRKRPERFLAIIILGVMVSALVPVFFFLPDSIRQIEMVREWWFVSVILKTWWVCSILPGFFAGIAFFLSLILLSYRQACLHEHDSR